MDLRQTFQAAPTLGQTRIVTMSGLPGGEPGATRPNWIVNAWNSGSLDVLDHQWKVAVPFWREIDRMAADHGVRVAIEMHPQNLLSSPPTLLELVERTGATHVGAEMDPSHLFWQGRDPVAAVRHLGPLVFHAAGKDVRINPNASVALGRGHDTAFCTRFLQALVDVDPEIAVNIEHEDVSLGRIEGLQVAAATLREAAAALR